MSEYIVKCNEVVGISGKTLIVPDYIDTSKEIVRCRDCVNFANWDGVKEFPWCVLHGIAIKPNGFCAWSERRDADNASD